jgi:hypothetical protein
VHITIDVVDAEPGGGEILLPTPGLHHVPERPCRPRLVVADTGVDQDVVVRRPHQIALDAHVELVLGIEESRVQPAAMLVEQLAGEGREEGQRRKECRLLLDDAVNGDAADRDLG